MNKKIWEAIEWIEAIVFNIQDFRYEGDDELIIKDLEKVKRILEKVGEKK